MNKEIHVFKKDTRELVASFVAAEFVGEVVLHNDYDFVVVERGTKCLVESE